MVNMSECHKSMQLLCLLPYVKMMYSFYCVCFAEQLAQHLSTLLSSASTAHLAAVGQMGEGGRHLQQAAIDDVKGYMEDVAPDGVDEHDALIAKLRDETNAAQSELPTEAAATGKWQ